MEAHQVCLKYLHLLLLGPTPASQPVLLQVPSCFTSVRLCCLQVSQVFDLESSACSGELMFMERYKEVLQELEQVEQKMENQSVSSSSSSSEGLGMAAGSGAGRCRLGSSGRSTLQAIGSAAAAGVSSSRPTPTQLVAWGCDSFPFSGLLQV